MRGIVTPEIALQALDSVKRISAIDRVITTMHCVGLMTQELHDHRLWYPCLPQAGAAAVT